MICKFCTQEFKAAQQGHCPTCNTAYVVGEPVELARAQLVALVHDGYYDPAEPEVWQLEIAVGLTDDDQLAVFGWDPSEEIGVQPVAMALGCTRAWVWRLIREERLDAHHTDAADGRSQRGKQYRIPRSAVVAYRRTKAGKDIIT